MNTNTASPDVRTLNIAGMTCASCANRIERKLNKLEGVVATVNSRMNRWVAIACRDDDDWRAICEEKSVAPRRAQSGPAGRQPPWRAFCCLRSWRT